MSKTPKSSRERVAAHRQRLRRRGLRQVQLTVLDTRSDWFRAEAERQSQAVANAAEEAEVMDFIEAVADWR